MKKTALLLIVGLLFGLLLTGCGGQGADNSAETIKIGTVFELTGNNSALGQSTLNGIKLAVKEINAAGGVLDKQIQLINEDNKSEAAEGTNATRKLIEQDKVTAILGSVASSSVLAAAPIAQAANVPWVAATATNPKVTEIGDGVFRVCFIDPFQGQVVAKFAYNTLKAKKAAIMRDITSDYSKGLVEAFRKNYEGEIVGEEAYSQKDTDFNAQLTKIKSLNPDVIFVPGYYAEVGLIAKQAKQLGIEAPLVGADGWDSPELIKIAGDAINGCYFSNHYTSQDTSPSVQDFVKKYQAEYNKVPDAFAALGYEAAQVLLNAIKEAGSTDGTSIKAKLAATKDFPTVTGKITLNEQRNAVKSAVMLEIKDGKQVFIERVQP
ncbi:MAG: ABC transporter substrate-binding protein [bacterium]